MPRRHRAFVIGPVLALLLVALLVPSAQAGEAKGKFIVVFNDSVSSPAVVAKKHTKKHGAEVSHVYRKSIKGYAATLKKKDLKAVRADSRVDYIVRDGLASIAKRGGNKPPSDGGDTSSVGSWGLDRIDQRDLPLDGSYTPTASGAGVTAYVIDTSVRIDHREFQGRASYGWDFVGNDPTASDCNGHGTHVAGTIAGKTYGVARGADVVALRVLGCNGSGWWSDIIAAIDWVAADQSGPSVANLSIGGGYSQPVNDAIADLVASGVTVAVAAGNENTDACTRSPAAEPTALTVASTTNSDARSSFSNFGPCVDIFAPGSSIKSAWHNKNRATKTISGTSMASPHVAGVAALILQGSPSATPDQVANAMHGDSSSGKIANPGGGSPNRLLYTD